MDVSCSCETINLPGGTTPPKVYPEPCAVSLIRCLSLPPSSSPYSSLEWTKCVLRGWPRPFCEPGGSSSCSRERAPPSLLLPLPSCRWVIWPQGRCRLLRLWLPPASGGAESPWGARGGKGRQGRFPSRGSLFIEGTQPDVEVKALPSKPLQHAGGLHLLECVSLTKPFISSCFLPSPQTAPQLLTVVVSRFWQGSWQAQRARWLGIRTLESSCEQPDLRSSRPAGSDGRPSSQGEGQALLASLGALVQLLVEREAHPS